MIQSIDYAAIAPPLILALAAGLVLLLDAFLGRPRAPGFAALGGVLLSTAAVAWLAVEGAGRATFCIPGELRGGGPASCSYVADRFTLVISAVMLGAAVVVVLLSMTELARGDVPAGEWYFLLLCAFAGAVALPASRDLVMLVVSLELVSLPVFVLAALRRYDGRAGEAALKLFLVSVVSTAVMLFGASLVYGVTGEIHLERIAAVLAGARFTDAVPAPGAGAPVAVAGVVLVLAGFAFKVAAVPFHFWAGDVYRGAPVPVAALLSVISKAAGFAGLILLFTLAFPALRGVWGPLVAVLAAATMTVGNLLALRQRHAVRLLAWSSVAQSGYILAPLASADRGAVPASVAYLALYAAMNMGAFAVVAVVARTRAGNELDDYRGLWAVSPWSAAALGFFLVCLAGLPPGLAGLFAKIVVFREVVAGGLGWLAIVMAINTVIGLYYYIAWAGRLFAAVRPGRAVPVTAPAGVAVAIALVATGVFSALPQLAISALG
ncbi:NADH-quinone oxidoreductase subunit N [Bailinhaonella thermotolerans]|uniref:NADH-quinone oxidoreductase subunit N n=1 Tax=Bailinhaonella thermotolerans TaxID=1070861 RepID=A0A3A4BF26_9ACTN|nr:NADH-quinone oxidoreductase subunit N [Bailinhaonella thermotolerans]RJL33062.1 NADH-quinone oxidoreductase subunit N [Bailinhaonella thermotolerans]